MHDLNYCMPDLNYCMPDLNYCGITAELLRNYCGITAELLRNYCGITVKQAELLYARKNSPCMWYSGVWHSAGIPRSQLL